MSYAQWQWLRVAVGMLGLAGTLAMATALLSARSWRLDLTSEQQHVLSAQARRILDELEDDVMITAFLRADDARNREIEDLLWRVRAASEHVSYRLIDGNRNPGVARRYGVTSFASLVVEADGRRKVFQTADEASLMVSIVQVTRPGRRRIYFLTGHGERRLRDQDPRVGYSGARAALIHELCDVEELSVLGDRPVPEDATVLVVAGPRRDVLASELLALDEYLRRGGSLLVLIDPGAAPNLTAWVRRYGISVGDDIVLDAENRLFAGDFMTMVVRERSPAHPVSARLPAEPLMSQIRPVAFVETDGVIAGLELLRTSATSWRTQDRTVFQTGVGQFVEGRDVQGPVPVGAVARVRGEDGRIGRLLVLGDSDFATNFFLDYLGNRDLLLNAMSWLAGDEGLIAGRPPHKAPGTEQFFVTARQGRVAFWLGTVVEPALILLIGTIIYGYRRRRG